MTDASSLQPRPQALIFLLVGALSTFSTFAILFIGVEFLHVNIVAASTIGWLVGAAINYCLNYKYTFRSSEKHHAAIMKFGAVIAGGVLANTAIMATLTRAYDLHYFAAQCIAVGVTIAITYSLNRSWAFKAKQ